MSHRSAHYAVFVNSVHLGAYEYATRAAMAEHVRFLLDWRDMPATAFRQADLRKRWARIARHGSSVQHFVIEAADQRISFDGMTEGEYRDATSAD